MGKHLRGSKYSDRRLSLSGYYDFGSCHDWTVLDYMVPEDANHQEIRALADSLIEQGKCLSCRIDYSPRSTGYELIYRDRVLIRRFDPDGENMVWRAAPIR